MSPKEASHPQSVLHLSPHLPCAFTPQTQLPSMQESDLLAAHGHELLHFEPIEPDEHAELDSEQGLHEFTTLRLKNRHHNI